MFDDIFDKYKKKFDETKFQETYKKMATKMGLSLDPDDPKHFYDYRALYEETGKLEPDESGHFPSKYKKEGHSRMIVGGVNTKTEEDIFDKYKLEKDIATEPTQFGIGAKAEMGITLPKPVEVPSYWGISDVTKPMDLSKLPETGKKIVQMLGGQIGLKLTEPETYKQIDDISKEINKQPDQLSKIAKAHELLTGESIEQSLKEMGEPTLQPWEKTGLTYKLGVGETEFVKLPEKFNQAQALAQQAMQFSTSGKIGDVMQTIARDAVLAYLVGGGLKILYQSGMKVRDKWITGDKLKAAVERAKKAYIPETGKFKDTLSNNDLAVVNRLKDIYRVTGGKIEEIEKVRAWGVIERGFKVPQVTLYAGLPADEIYKLIVTTNKVVTKAVKGLDPAKISQVAQQLLNTSPALASEFLKAVEKPTPPEVYKGKAYRAETYIPEHGADIIAKMDTAQEKLDYDASTTGNPIFKEAGDLAENLGIDLNKVPVTEMVWVAPDMKTAEKYGEAEEYKLPQDTIVLAKDEEGGSLVLKNSEKYIEEPKAPPEEPPPKEPWEPMVLPTPKVPEREYDFKEPTIKMYYTPKKQLLREIGAEPILKDLIEKKESLMVKTPKVNKWIGDVIKEINKKATFAEKLKAKTFNLPTEQVARFRDLLNAYEKSPDFLDPDTKVIFDKLRTFTKSMLNDANEMRVKAGLYPITDFGAYVPHFLDEIARAVRLDPVARKKVEHIVGKKLPKGGNPTALQRQIGAELDHIFSKDLGKLLTTMAKYDLRDIYLAEPYSIVRAELKQLIKDKAIPQSVLNEVENYIKFDVFDYQVPVDRIINTTLKPGTDIINLFLKPFNRVITNPIQNISSMYRQLLLGGAVAGKVRMLPRNLMQRMLNITLYPVTDSVKAQFSAPKEVVDKIRATNIYQLSIRKFEDVPTTFRAVQVGMVPYAKTHAGLTYFSNVDVSSRVGWNYGERMKTWQQTPKAMKYTKDYAKKMNYKEGSQKYKDLFWREGDQLEEAKEAIAKTQWEYYPTGMPRAYRGHMARMMWSLNSWWMNYFGQHAPEMFSRTRGTTSRGRIVRRVDRLNAIKGLAIILGISAALKEKTGVDPARFLVFPFPSYVYPHLFQVMLNTYYVFGAKNEKERATYLKKLKSNYKMLIPYSGAWKRYVQFLRGELTWKEWMFYVEQEAKKSVSPTAPFDKYEPSDVTGEDVFDKYGKETVTEDVFDKYKR